MAKSSKHPVEAGSRQIWLRTAALTAGGIGLVALITLPALLGAMRELDKMKATYAAKTAFAGQKAKLEERKREAEASLEEWKVKLIEEAQLSDLTQRLFSEARTAGCSVLSIRPSPRRVLTHPKEPKAGRPSAKKKKKLGPNLLEWPMQVRLRGEYGNIISFLGRLHSQDTLFRTLRLTMSPDDEERKILGCSLELASYEVRRGKKEREPK